MGPLLERGRPILYVKWFLLSSHQGNQVFYQEVAAQQQPDEESEGQNERLGSCLLELVNAGICTQGCHGHGQHEGIDVFDGSVQGDVLHGRGIEEVLEQGIQADDADEAKGKPGNGNLALGYCAVGRYLLRPARAKLMMTNTGARSMTRIILVMVAVPAIPSVSVGSMALPAPATWATSCRVLPV